MLKKALLCLGALVIAGSAFAQGPVGNYDPLTLTCVSSGDTYVTLGIKAGPSGAPAGFSLQWMKLSDWEANGGAWYASDDPRLCKMSFSGQPSFSGAHAPLRWELGPNAQIELKIGDYLFDETGVSGALTDPANPDCYLECGTEYVFRTFAHASRFSGRSCFSFVGTADNNEVGSPFSCNVAPGGAEVVEPGDACSTKGTNCSNPCTYTQGYWKTHGDGACHNGNNADQWCVASLNLGTVNYTKLQLCTIMNTPGAGNGFYNLAHQLIAAKLNSACNGATCADALIAAADAFIGNKTAASGITPGSVGALVASLTTFNEGDGCADHCSRPALKPAGAQQKMRWGTLKSHYR